MDKVIIKDLVARGVIGVNDWEREKAQEIVIKQMEDYFFGEGAALPPDYVPPRAKQ